VAEALLEYWSVGLQAPCAKAGSAPILAAATPA